MEVSKYNKVARCVPIGLVLALSNSDHGGEDALEQGGAIDSQLSQQFHNTYGNTTITIIMLLLFTPPWTLHLLSRLRWLTFLSRFDCFFSLFMFGSFRVRFDDKVGVSTGNSPDFPVLHGPVLFSFSFFTGNVVVEVDAKADVACVVPVCFGQFPNSRIWRFWTLAREKFALESHRISSLGVISKNNQGSPSEMIFSIDSIIEPKFSVEMRKQILRNKCFIMWKSNLEKFGAVPKKRFCVNNNHDIYMWSVKMVNLLYLEAWRICEKFIWCCSGKSLRKMSFLTVFESEKYYDVNWRTLWKILSFHIMLSSFFFCVVIVE